MLRARTEEFFLEQQKILEGKYPTRSKELCAVLRILLEKAEALNFTEETINFINYFEKATGDFPLPDSMTTMLKNTYATLEITSRRVKAGAEDTIGVFYQDSSMMYDRECIPEGVEAGERDRAYELLNALDSDPAIIGEASGSFESN